MLNEKSKEMVDAFLSSAKEELVAYADQLDASSYERAAGMIKESMKNGNRLHITGIGKPAHVAQYMASLFSSTGTPCYYLHGTEAVHGSCGQLVAGDVVICISNSGETQEMKATAQAIRNNGCAMIAVTADSQSWLADFCDEVLLAGVNCEGGPLDRAPRNSILAELLTLQALSVALQAERQWSVREYLRCHPGGKLGQIREGEKEVC